MADECLTHWATETTLPETCCQLLVFYKNDQEEGRRFFFLLDAKAAHHQRGPLMSHGVNGGSSYPQTSSRIFRDNQFSVHWGWAVDNVTALTDVDRDGGRQSALHQMRQLTRPQKKKKKNWHRPIRRNSCGRGFWELHLFQSTGWDEKASDCLVTCRAVLHSHFCVREESILPSELITLNDFL